jgi:hypothetical protein
VHELGLEQPKTTKELLDIATRQASGEEAVEGVFVQSSGTKRGIKSNRRGPRWWPHRVTVATSCDEGINDKELMATAEHDIKRQTWLPADHFEKLLKATCPNHMYPIKHKLKECTMMKNYMTTGTFARSNKPEGDSTGKVATPFPEENAVMSICGRPAPPPPRVTPQAQAHQLARSTP